MPSNANYLGSHLFTSQNKSPGHISPADALEANDIAQLVNDKSTTKFPHTSDQPSLPDIQSPGLASAPGELVGRAENKIHRPKPFGDIDAVKASSWFKKALYDVNVDTINTTNQAPSLARPTAPESLDKMVSKAPRLGDFKADAPVDDTRDYDGAAPTREVGNVKAKDSGQSPISNKYQTDGGLKVATPIPEAMMAEDDWEQPNGDDDFDDGEHQTRKIDNTGNLAHVGVAQGIPGSRGTFVSHFLRKIYGK